MFLIRDEKPCFLDEVTVWNGLGSADRDGVGGLMIEISYAQICSILFIIKLIRSLYSTFWSL